MYLGGQIMPRDLLIREPIPATPWFLTENDWINTLIIK